MQIVYILTNECMPGTVKIGFTDGNLEQRIKSLDNTSVALPFQCYYAVEVSDASRIEKKIHDGLDNCRVRQNREFFNITPERAKSFLDIAEIMGGRNVTPAGDIVKTPQDQQALDNARQRRQRFKFSMLGIEPGTELQFKQDKTITCTVEDDTKVRFRGQVTSLSKSANHILEEMGYDWDTVNGTLWWCFGNKTLNELRSDSEAF